MEVSFLIVGTPRSGTTLVQRLACELPGVAMPPETHFFSSGYADGVVARGGFPLHEPRFDEELDAYAVAYESWAGRKPVLDARRLKAIIGGSCGSITELFAAIVGGLAPSGSILGEKTPDHIRWWRPISRAMPNVKFVFVVRDPRAVVESILRMPWGSDSHVVLAERWRWDQRCALAARRTLGQGRCLQVRYEDVVRDPERSRRVLASFLGTGEADVADGRDHEHIDGFVLPWETWKEQALTSVTTEKVEIWRVALPTEVSLDVAAICRGQMKRFGYEIPGNAAWAHGRLARLEPTLRKRRRRIRRRMRDKQREIDAVEF